MDRVGLPAAILESRIIAVLRAQDASRYDRVIEILCEEGLNAIEVTLSTPGTLDHLASLISRGIRVGVGTVTCLDQARRAVNEGASFLVTPIVDESVIEFAKARGVPVFPGGMSPTELYRGWSLGATAVKIFPAGVVGPLFARHLRGPFKEIEFMPSGGVELQDVSAWFRVGALAVSLGGALIGDALRGGDLGSLRSRVRRTLAMVPRSAAEGQ